MKICVFCASASGLAEKYVEAARETGRQIGERGHELVFGGYETGTMGTVAQSAKAAGARVTGVLPCKSGELPGRPEFACDDLVEAADLNDRKVKMMQLADAFVVLPGSYGTLDEFYTVISNQKLFGRDGARKPIAVLNLDGFYAPLAELDRRMIADGFMHPGVATLYQSFEQVDALMNYIERR